MQATVQTQDLNPLGLTQTAFCKLVHDLRTPINGVIGLATLLRTGHSERVSTEAILDMMQRSAQHMLALVNDILDLASAQAGALKMTTAEVAVQDVLADVRAMTGMQAEAKRLDLRLEVAPGVPAVLTADRRRLTQVLTNLVSNAIDFTRTGSVQVLLSPAPVRPGQTGRAGIRFEVRDSGIGMTADELGRVFQPFVQAPAGVRRGGNGLGLAICRDLVQRMGGSIAIESQPGQGTCFSFTLELGPVIAPPPLSPTVAASPAQRPAAAATVATTGAATAVPAARPVPASSRTVAFLSKHCAFARPDRVARLLSRQPAWRRSKSSLSLAHG